MTQLDDFTLNLLTNDEVLAVDQDPLGKQASQIVAGDDRQVWAKPLADGTWAVGLFNLSDADEAVTVDFKSLNLSGPQKIRDLWRQKDLPDTDGQFSASVHLHGVVMVKIGSPAR